MSESELDDSTALNSPIKIAQAGEAIYRNNFKEKYETTHQGHFVVIDVRDEKAYVDESSEKALQKAREQAPYGIFHLIRIGSPGAFKANSISSHDEWDWSLRSTG